MRRRRWGIWAELTPLVLLLACLAGSLGLIVAAYRRVHVARLPRPQPPMVAIAPSPPPAPALEPSRVGKRSPLLADEPPPPPPVDPTPRALAGLAAAEAEQLLAASQANRKAQALEDARQSAVAESERWRRRQSLIHAQVGSLESKVRKLEADLDSMALERDALERELDARKAAVARAKSRPSQAILPHKGPNGTWRRPVIVECRNGAAVIQPQGIEFGLLDLESGFGPSSNPFVAAVAREAIRVQHTASPDGAPVVPYIFFLVRPDGIRPYYEARGRLEPLGITFGYELADAEWEIDFPDLDDVATWDGSVPATRSNPPTLTRTSPGTGASAEDADLPSWPTPRGNGRSPGSDRGGDPRSPFTFGGSGGGGNARSSSIMGRPFGETAIPPPGSRLAGLNGGGGGGGRFGASSTGAIADAWLAADDSGPPGPAPAGFPASLLAGGEGAQRDGSSLPSGEPKTPVGTGGDGPPGTTGTRITADGRIRAGGEELRPGSSTTPGSKAGGGGTKTPALGRGRPTAPGTPLEPGEVPTTEKADLLRGRQSGTPGAEVPPVELALDGPTPDLGAGGKPLERGQATERGDLPRASASPTGPNQTLLGASASHGPAGTEPGELPPLGGAKPIEPDPASTFVWPGGPATDGRKAPQGSAGDDASLALPATNAERLEVAEGADPTLPATGGGGSAKTLGNPGGSGGSQAAGRMLGQPANWSGQPSASASPTPTTAGPMGIGLNSPLPSPSSLPSLPPPGAIPPAPPLNLPIPRYLPTPTEAGAAVQRQTSAPPNLTDWVPPGSVVDKTFEIVVVCNPDGVIVQPGNYRVTADALKDRDGLFKKQVVALVKNRRLADPTTQVDPRVRFLVQPRGFDTYRLARSQFYVSGLNWPTAVQVADPDPLVIRSRGVW